MSLRDEERQTLTELYLRKSDEALNDSFLCVSQARWNASANRLYYSLFHAITALFVSDGILVRSHNGMKVEFGKKYVLTGLASEEEGKLLSQMETMRERADYDATFTASEPIIKERLEAVETMIKHIKELVHRNRI